MRRHPAGAAATGRRPPRTCRPTAAPSRSSRSTSSVSRPPSSSPRVLDEALPAVEQRAPGTAAARPAATARPLLGEVGEAALAASTSWRRSTSSTAARAAGRPARPGSRPTTAPVCGSAASGSSAPLPQSRAYRCRSRAGAARRAPPAMVRSAVDRPLRGAADDVAGGRAPRPNTRGTCACRSGWSSSAHGRGPRRSPCARRPRRRRPPAASADGDDGVGQRRQPRAAAAAATPAAGRAARIAVDQTDRSVSPSSVGPPAGRSAGPAPAGPTAGHGTGHAERRRARHRAGAPGPARRRRGRPGTASAWSGRCRAYAAAGRRSGRCGAGVARRR